MMKKDTNNQILNATNVKSKIHGNHQYLLPGPMFGPFSFINICIGGEELDSDQCSDLTNRVEVAVAMKIVNNLYKATAWNGSKQKLRVGLVSPCNAQVDTFIEKLGKKYDNVNGFSVKAWSIDGYREGKVDVVILSAVRFDDDRSIEFISKHQKTNSGLTTRHSLWILGNGKTLCDSGLEWKSFIQSAKERNCFFNAEEDEDLAKLLVEVERQMNELEDSLNADSILFKNAKWKVIFSDNFRKSFSNLRSSMTKKLVIYILLRLSSGWRPRKRNVELACSSSQILKQFKVEDLYVICSVDIQRESVYIQVLKVWDILPLEDVPELVKRLDEVLTMYNDDYLNRCKIKRRKGELEIPMSWNISSDILCFKNQNGSNSNVDAQDGRSYLENAMVNESLLLMKFYSLSSGTAKHLLSCCDGQEMGFPFELTYEELEITNFSESSFILGRSGTGKTTVLIMKIFQREQLYHLATEGFHEVDNSTSIDVISSRNGDKDSDDTKGAFLRQLFVTVSPKLCYAVKENISRMQRFTCGRNSTAEGSSVDMDDIDEATQFKDIPDSFVNLPITSYPLVITFHKFVMMLDATLGRSYFERFPEVRQLSQGEDRGSRSVAFQTFIRVKEVNYERFRSSYWPHFNRQLVKNFDSSVVFTEIISHIKGVGKRRAFDRKLSFREYMFMSKGQVHSLSSTERERIYEIFLQYEKKKMDRHEFDLADLVIDLHRRFQDDKYNGDKMDFVYVDEVQDLTMRQVSLFKYICTNFESGFVFSGDTAQTIARGVDFRFQDIRSLFYKYFMLKSRSHSTNVKSEKGQIADIFQLSQNFRTHCGVLKLSQSILDLLYYFFPSSIDVLSPEKSPVYGEAPVLLEPTNNENILESIFQNVASTDKSMVGFGAEQVILVRDERVKAEILDYVGNQALVLTISECKGLEFQDVLLYNFFSSSPLENQWRIVYDYMEKKNVLHSTSMSSPRLNSGNNSVLCSELKQLYVAITRTRQRLWIFENVEELTTPMFKYWNKLCLVQVRPVDHSFVQEIQVPSSKKDWRSRGVKLFHQHNYEMAQMCFKKAGDAYWEKWAKASGLRAKANHMADSNPDMARIFLKTAAELFDSIGKTELAAECFFELNEYETAGKIYLEKFGESRLREAGECFVLAKCYESAAHAYAKGNLFSKCLSACLDGKLFDMGMQYIEYWKQHSASDYLGKRRDEIENSAQHFLESTARYHHQIGDYETMIKFVKDFHSKTSIRSFMMNLGHLDKLLLLEKEWGCFAEAAHVAKLKGDVFLEVDLLEMAGKFQDASTLILNYVLCNSLWEQGSEGWPVKHFLGKNDLLTKCKCLANNASSDFSQLVNTEARILSDEWKSLFEMEKCLRNSRTHRSVKGKILCARKILDAHFECSTSHYKWENHVVINKVGNASQRLSKNQVSVETLNHFWNLWKWEIEKVLKNLTDLDDQQDTYAEFCLNYFGLRKEYMNEKQRLILMNPDAHWSGVIGKWFFKRKGNLFTIDENCFVRAACIYWSSEMISVGMKVIEKLESLYTFSCTSSFSNFLQSKTLAHILGAKNSLTSSNFLNHGPCYGINEDLISRFFDNLFSIQWGKSMARSAILFRETDLCKDALEEVICTNIEPSSDQLTYEKIGRVVTVLLGSPKLTGNLYPKIAASFKRFPRWHAWIQAFRASKGWIDHRRPAANSTSTDISIEVAHKLQEALQDSFHARTKLMSPTCFLYLAERLLVMICYLNGYIFTTRNPLVEWLISQKWNPRTFSPVEDEAPLSFQDAMDFLALAVQQVLCHEHDTKQWIEESSANLQDVHQQVVLRMIVMMCLLCVITGNLKHWDVMSHLLNQENITTRLPPEFCETLQRWKPDGADNMNISILAEACRKIGNPLVLVNAGGDSSRFRCQDVIFIDLDEKRSKKNMLIRKLFS